MMMRLLTYIKIYLSVNVVQFNLLVSLWTKLTGKLGDMWLMEEMLVFNLLIFDEFQSLASCPFPPKHIHTIKHTVGNYVLGEV